MAGKEGGGGAGRISRLDVGVILAVSLALNACAICWGLPNGNKTWAPDGLTPMEPLAVAYRLFGGGWNSGWFDWKYPPGHALSLAILYAPYLAWLRVSGGLGALHTQYPYGFIDPERSLMVLALIGRWVSAIMASVGGVLWYKICAGVSVRCGRIAAILFITTYPVVYYAHTTNVDGPMLFWVIVAIYGATRAVEGRRPLVGYLIMGVGASMAFSVKESALGIVAVLPAVVVARSWVERRVGAADQVKLLLAAALLGMVVFVAMNGVVTNPAGVVNRLKFLTYTLDEETRRAYAPHYHPVGAAGWRGVFAERHHAWETLKVSAQALGWPIVFVAVVGAALAAASRMSIMMVIAAPAVGYYLLSVRSLQTVRPRFVLPLCLFATGFVGLAFDIILKRARGWRARSLAHAALGGCVILGLLRGVEATRTLWTDPRYAAEAWLERSVVEGAAVEVYQPETYLPRLSKYEVSRVAFMEISIEGFLSRRPDYVIVSSAGIAGITSKYVEDWRVSKTQVVEGAKPWGRGVTGDPLTHEFAANRDFLDALQAGCLGFMRVAKFESPTWLPRLIKGIAPTIVIYGRSAAGVLSGERCEAFRGAVERAVAGRLPERVSR